MAQYECAFDATITLPQIQTAHRNAAAHNPSSHSRYFRILKNYLEVDYIRRARRNASASTITTSQQPPREVPEPATTEQLTHLAYANAAMAYLRVRKTHFSYLSKNSESSSTTTSDAADSLRYPCIRLTDRYIVPTRSNLIIDGLPSIKRDSARGTRVYAAATMYAFLSALYGGLHLAGWGFEFASEIERWGWRGSGLMMIAAPVGTVLVSWSLSVDSRTYQALRTDGSSHASSSHASSSSSMTSAAHASPLTNPGIFFRRSLQHALSILISLVMYPSLMVAAVGWMMYPFARLYVLAEVFAALRASDPDVYRKVEWANWIPHVG